MRIRLSLYRRTPSFLLSVWASVVDCLCLEEKCEGGTLSFVHCKKKQMSTEAKPFLKWAGGKGQLLLQLDELLAHELNQKRVHIFRTVCRWWGYALPYVAEVSEHL